MMKKAQVGGKWLKERKVEIYFQTRTATRSHLTRWRNEEFNARKSLLPALQLSHKCCSLGPQNLSSGIVSDVSVSLYEGDSVSLHTNTKTQKDHLIEWRFGDQQDLIARINGEPTSLKIYDDVLDGRFKDKLKVNTENGDLTITNITTNNNTGDYKLEISNRAITRKTFIINVSGDEVTVKVGVSVISVKNVIKKPGDEKMMWRIRHNNSLVAEMNDMVLTYNVNNVRFRDRLQLDYQTGDLNITNIRPDDSGSYKVDITLGSHAYTIHRSFNVNVKEQGGLSTGDVAGISLISLLITTAAAAVVAGVFYHRKISKTIKILDEKIKVEKGHNAVLKAGLKELKAGDKIEWRYGQDTEMKYPVIMWPWRSPGTLIAKCDKENFNTYNGPDERFKYKLSLDRNTGDLIINDVSNKHFGVYQLKVTSGGKTSYKRINMFVTGETKLTVYEGESVRLETKVTDIQRVDLIEWTFRSEDCVIAKINPANNIFSTYDGNDGEFRDRLHLDPQTGDLTIDDITWGHRGYYTLKIITDGETYYRRLLLPVKWNTVCVDNGYSVDLETDLTDIKRDDVIEWRFNETLIAEINPVNNIFSTYDGDDDLFRDKLNLNNQTGDLTISDFRREHKGDYRLKIIRGGKTSYKRFSVCLGFSMLKVDVGKFVNLKTKVTDIKRDDVIEWRFKGTLIAEINPANNIFSTYDGDDDLFRDKLELNHQTGDLTIKDFREEHKGDYRLKIIRGGKTLERNLSVSIRLTGEIAGKLFTREGVSVDLDTYLNDIKRVEKIEWRFNETLIAEINPANNIFSIYDDDYDLFRGKLKLNHRTGDLNIKNLRDEHEGLYEVKIIRDGETSYRRTIVCISGKKLEVYEGESVDLKTKVTDIRTDDVIKWRFNGTLIAEINLANNIFSTYDGDDDLFRDKLNLNPQTGDLAIKDIRQKHAGLYRLEIIRDGETSDRFFTVSVKAPRGEDPVRKRN
ncbi:uncharacterized protein [Misgurnus anguillicaudatus]|uniref:uncharacterized protein isoform X2 n=1 Tax=Misgurnus anguillicaudatus TaxID=75329 RepID=UPI003CCFCA53